MRPHRDTEAVLSRLTEGDSVAVTRERSTRWGTVVDVGLGGVAVRWIDGTEETVTVHSATQTRGDVAELEVRP